MREGNRKIGIELPNVSDPEKAKARIGTAAILELKPVYDHAETQEELIERAGGKLPEGTMIIPGRKEEAGFHLVPTFAKVTGKHLKDAKYQLNTGDFFAQGTPHTIAIEFKPEGAKKFYELTKENAGKQLAIILDNVVVSAPRVDKPIEGGTASIYGRNITQESAEE